MLHNHLHSHLHSHHHSRHHSHQNRQNHMEHMELVVGMEVVVEDKEVVMVMVEVVGRPKIVVKQIISIFIQKSYRWWWTECWWTYSS